MTGELKTIKNSATLIYRLTLGNVISSNSPGELVLDQGVKMLFDDSESKESYYITLRGVKVRKKIYQPTEIEAELDFMLKTMNTSDTEQATAPSFKAVSAMFFRREVQLDIVHVNEEIKPKENDNTANYYVGDIYNVAKSCFVFEVDPQLRRDVSGTKMFVKLNIFSMDKLMTLNKYSKAYVARKLGSGILKPESLSFGKKSNGESPLIKTDIKALRFLKYEETGTAPGIDGQDQETTITSEFIQPYLVQYNETFYDFLVRTANRCGEFLYFEDGALTLGLPDSGDAVEIDDFEAVTIRNISDAPLDIKAHTRDSMKEGDGDVSDLNQSVIKRDTDFPNDAFAENTSSNAELANDEYIFPLKKDKFSDLARETYWDGTRTDKALSRLIPFFKTVMGNTTGGGAGLGATLANAMVVGELFLYVKAYSNAGTANDEGLAKYMDPYDGKEEQYKDDMLVQFSTLKKEGWTTIDYYNDIYKHEVEQQRQIVCINMGTDYIHLKLGQKINIKGLEGNYVVIQIQQVSEEGWDIDYDKYDDTETSDKSTGRRLLKIYAIPAYNVKEGDTIDVFIPPVQPVPMVRKAGPQTAFVTDNVDPKYQGRVRVAYPWQSLGGALMKEVKAAAQKLTVANEEKEKLEKEKEQLANTLKALNEQIDNLKKYVNATPEDRAKMLADDGLEELQSEIAEKQTERNNKASELAQLCVEIKRLQDKKKLSEQEKKALETALCKKKLLEDEINDLDNQIKEKQEKVMAINSKHSEMQAAAREHDQKNGNNDFKYDDIEVDNTVIARKKDAYNNIQASYQACCKSLGEKEQDVAEALEENEKIQEYYDESAKMMSTPWVRVVSPMATPGGGTFFRPRIGDEVLVNFDNDNIERPYVIGSLYSKNVLTPDESLYRKAAPEMQWKNISMSMMSPNGHHITFTDPPGGNNFITNAISPGIGFYATIIPGISDLNAMGENWKDLSGGIHIGDRYGLYEIEMLSHKRQISIRSPFGTVDIDAFKGININAPNGDVTIKGMNITLEAGNKLTMKSGLNIEEPSIDDPEGTGAYVGAKAVGIIGSVLDAVAPDYIESIVDFSLIRRVVEVFVRPVDGTTLIKSKRYLKLEAGSGNATVKRDRYSDKSGTKKEKGLLSLIDQHDEKVNLEEFYKAVLKALQAISDGVEEYYMTYSSLWITAHGKKMRYLNDIPPCFMEYKYKKTGGPNIAEVAWNHVDSEWDDGFITPDLFKDYWSKVKYSSPDHTACRTPEAKFEYSYDYITSYCQAAHQLYQHVMNGDHLFEEVTINDIPEDFSWVIDCAKRCTGPIAQCWNTKWIQTYASGKDKFLKQRRPADDDVMSKINLTIFKRKIILSFLHLLNDDPHNLGNKFIKVGFDMDYVNKTDTYRQEHYWKRQVLILDHKWQKSKLWRTLYEGVVDKFISKFKSNFSSLDQDVWNSAKEGQILFSDQEGSTLNFEGSGLHEETDANIGTMDYLKKVLMKIK